MSEANETITKVAAEWQKLADYFGCKAKVSRRDAEAQSGNAAAMREALMSARDLLLPQCNGGTAFAKSCAATVNKIMDALAAPTRKRGPRNAAGRCHECGAECRQNMRFCTRCWTARKRRERN